MTGEELGAIALHANAYLLEHPNWRAGQAHWNALAQSHPDIAARLHGTPADCFHDNARIPTFFAALIT